MEFPQQVVTEITVPNNVPFAPGYDVIGIGTQLPPAVIAAGYPAAILFYSSSYSPVGTVPQIKYQFIADKGGTIYFGYGLVANASVSQAETIVVYEAHGFASTDAQSQFTNVTAAAMSVDAGSFGNLVANTSFVYKGTELQTLLNAITAQLSSLGMIAYGNIGQASGPFVSSGAVKTPWFYIGANLIAGRTYRLVMTSVQLNYATANSTANLLVNFTTNGTVPNIATGGATTNLITKPYTIPQFNQGCDITVDFQASATAQWNFLFGLDNTVTNHPATATCSLLGSVTMTVSDIGLNLPNSGQVAFVAPPAQNPYTVDQLATTSRAFLGNGTLMNTGAEMYIGQSPYGPNGIQYSDLFFTGSGPGTLAYCAAKGMTAGNVKTCRLTVTVRHWYYSGGGILRFGYTDGGGYHLLTDRAIGPAPYTVTFDLVGSGALTAIAAGTFQAFNFGGIAGNQCPAGNYNYYCYLDGSTSGVVAPVKPVFHCDWVSAL